MMLPNTAHTSRPWRIHELTRDFRLEDVWALPTPGGLDDFPRLVRLMASGDRSQGGSSRAARTLWAMRWKVGSCSGGTHRTPATGSGCRPSATGGYRGQMAVYVKPNGLLGTAYMATIKPIRYVIVYPALMRQIEREWRASAIRHRRTLRNCPRSF
jgi:hypothetical protein